MPNSPCAEALDLETEEAAFLQSMPGSSHLVRPSSKAVIEALAGVDIVHLACHAQANPRDVASSCLIFYDSENASNEGRDILTVHALADLRLAQSSLA